jgi:hypothetical protein
MTKMTLNLEKRIMMTEYVCWVVRGEDDLIWRYSLVWVERPALMLGVAKVEGEIGK